MIQLEFAKEHSNIIQNIIHTESLKYITKSYNYNTQLIHTQITHM